MAMSQNALWPFAAVQVVLFGVLMKMYPLRIPSDICSCSALLGQIAFCLMFAALLKWGNPSPPSLGQVVLQWLFPSISFVVILAICVALGFICKILWAWHIITCAVSLPLACIGIYLKRRKDKRLKREQEKRNEERNAQILVQKEKQRLFLERKTKEREEIRQAKEAAILAAKTEFLAKFDAVAKNGKIKKENFKEALQPYLQELVKNAHIDELLNKADPTGSTYANIKTQLPIADMVCEDVAKIIDCDKLMDMLFRLIDVNQDGSMERAELQALVDELCKLKEELDRGGGQSTVFALAFRLVDRNQDGKLDLVDFQFLLDVCHELMDFAAKTCFHFGSTLFDAPVFQDELTNKLPPFVCDNRAECVKSLEDHLNNMIGNVWDAFPCAPAVVYKGLLSSIEVVKSIHHATDASGGSFLTSMYLAVNDLFRGGIDEESFVGMLAPMIKKRMMTKPNLDGFKKSLQAIKAAQSGGLPCVNAEQCEPLESKIVSAAEKHWGIIDHAVQAAQGEAAAVATNFSRALFELADIDDDGKISLRECSIVKDFFNSFVKLAVVMTLHHESETAQELPEIVKRELEAMCPAAFAVTEDKEAHFKTIFVESLIRMVSDGYDYLDKNADGKLTNAEVASHIVKILRLGLRLLESVWDSYVAGMKAFDSEGLPEIWKQAEITDITMENLPVVAASVQALLSS